MKKVHCRKLLTIFCLLSWCGIVQVGAQTTPPEEFCFTQGESDILQTFSGFPKLNQLNGDIFIRLYPHIVQEAMGSAN